jgi:homoaconitase/3-isopropylmalate dehydratase large subunit
MSPAMVAAAAVAGEVVDVREFAAAEAAGVR